MNTIKENLFNKYPLKMLINKKTAELTTAFNLWNTITNLAKEL